MHLRFHASPGVLRGIGLAGVLLVCSFTPALAQTLFVVNATGTTVGAYDANTGAVINASFISSPIPPVSVAVSGNDLFVGYWGDSGGNGNGRGVARYNATTGALIDSSFIPGVAPMAMTVLNNTLYVSDAMWNTVGSYNATTGAVINASLISSGVDGTWIPLAATPSIPNTLTPVIYFGSFSPAYNSRSVGAFMYPPIGWPDDPPGISTEFLLVDANGIPHGGAYGLASSGSTVWAVHQDGAIVAYDTSSGNALGAFAAIMNTHIPYGVAVYDNTLFVSDLGGTVASYNATTGALINANLITGLDGPFSMAVLPASAVPEPATYAALLGLAAVGAVIFRRRSALKAGKAGPASR